MARFLFGKSLNHYLARVILDKSIRIEKHYRRGPERNELYKAWVRTLPCACGCGSRPCEAAHTGSDGGMRQKASDLTCVPLWWECHREYHRIGKASFERARGIRFATVVHELNGRYRTASDSEQNRT
jgi:hypothetical protein